MAVSRRENIPGTFAELRCGRRVRPAEAAMAFSLSSYILGVGTIVGALAFGVGTGALMTKSALLKGATAAAPSRVERVSRSLPSPAAGAQGKSGATCCCHASYRGCGGASPRSCFLGSARAAQGGYPKRSGGKTAGADTTGRLSQSAASPAGEAGRAPGPARQALRGTQDA
jgi:hypothetical protein